MNNANRQARRQGGERWERDDFIKALDANMLTPIALIKALVPSMIDRGWGRVVNITSQSVKSPIPVLGLSNAARAGLTGYVAGTSRQVAGKGVVINNLLPGIHDTDRATALDGGVAKAEGITPQQARTKREGTIPAGRYGTAAEFGATRAAFLLLRKSIPASIVGQKPATRMRGGECNALSFPGHGASGADGGVPLGRRRSWIALAVQYFPAPCDSCEV